MKAIALLKKNARKVLMAGLAAYVLFAGIVAPMQCAFAGDEAFAQPRAKQAQVLHRYKSFSNGMFVDPKYDTVTKIYTFPNELIYRGDRLESSTWGNHPNGAIGIVNQYQCQYEIR